MNLVVLCPHFEPDVAPTGEVMTRIVHELVARGHRVQIVTALPWYQRHAIEPGWEGRLIRRERRSWGRITRVHPFPTDQVATSPPGPWPSVGSRRWRPRSGSSRSATRCGAGHVPAAHARTGRVARGPRPRVPFVFNIQDVFPDVAIELGLLEGAQAIACGRTGSSGSTYRLSDAVTVLSDDLADNVRAKITRGRWGARTPHRRARSGSSPTSSTPTGSAPGRATTPTAASSASATLPW